MADPSVVGVRVDDAGLHLEPGFTGSGDVFFDGHHAWSFSAGEGGRSGDEVLVEWPKRMTRWLNGSSLVRVVSGDDEIFAGEVSFGDGRGRVAFVDKDGIPVMIDKWGLLQRPFSGRDRSVVRADGRGDRRDPRRDGARVRCPGLDRLRHAVGGGAGGPGDRPRLRHRPGLPQREAHPVRDGHRAVRRGAGAAPPRPGRPAQVRVVHHRGLQVPRRRHGQHRHLHLLPRRRPALRDGDGARAGAAVGDRAADRAGVRGPDAARARPPRPDARGQLRAAAGGCPTRRSSTPRDPR